MVRAELLRTQAQLEALKASLRMLPHEPREVFAATLCEVHASKLLTPLELAEAARVSRAQLYILLAEAEAAQEDDR